MAGQERQRRGRAKGGKRREERAGGGGGGGGGCWGAAPGAPLEHVDDAKEVDFLSLGGDEGARRSQTESEGVRRSQKE